MVLIPRAYSYYVTEIDNNGTDVMVMYGLYLSLTQLPLRDMDASLKV